MQYFDRKEKTKLMKVVSRKVIKREEEGEKLEGRVGGAAKSSSI